MLNGWMRHIIIYIYEICICINIYVYIHINKYCIYIYLSTPPKTNIHIPCQNNGVNELPAFFLGRSLPQHWFSVDSMKVYPLWTRFLATPQDICEQNNQRAEMVQPPGNFPGNVLWVLCLGRQSVSCFLTCCFLIWKVSFPLWRMANRSQVPKLTLYMVGIWINCILSGQITIIPKPELRSFWGDSPTKPPFGVTSAEVVIICPDIIY